MYFLNGMFWQRGQIPFIGSDPEAGEILMVGNRQLEAVFNGLVGEHSLTDGSDGFLVDIFGRSFITGFSLQENQMNFFKQYIHRVGNNAFLIKYAFVKTAGEVWMGTWEAPAIGNGEAKCILSEIPENFFTQVE